MKQELFNSLNVLWDSLSGVHVSGKENIYRMRDAFVILDGMLKYVSNLPEEEQVSE